MSRSKKIPVRARLKRQQKNDQFLNRPKFKTNSNFNLFDLSIEMAVLAASIITHSGKAILSRQFCDLTKNRVTELLAQFPSLLSENTTQHTTVEDEHVRYVYQPLDDLYIILITNRQSNILQDIETLNTFAETVTALLRTINENEIFENAFEILSAFDEIITLGYKENLSLLQIRTFLEMDSHEEKIQEIIERNKELEATEERKRRAKEIQRKELAKRNNEFSQYQGGQQYGSAPGGFGGDQYRTNQDYQSQQQQSYSPAPVDEAPSRARIAPKGRGLQLGKSRQKSVVADQTSEPLISAPEVQQPRIAQQPQYHDVPEPIADDKPINNGILVTLEEKVTAHITREGSIQLSEFKGALQLRINDSNLALSKILLSNENNDNSVQFKTHPNVDRSLFSQNNIIGLKNPEKPFPSNDQSIGVLRWKGVAKGDDNKFVPILFSTWLSENGETIDVTLEFELNENYKEYISDITILVPIVTENVELKSDDAQIVNIDDDGVLFKIEKLSPGENGVLEFSIEAPNEEALFPIEIGFKNENPVNTLGSIKVLDVVSVENEESLPFDLNSELSTEGYFIV